MQAKGRKNDVLIALTTSGNSLNVVNALKAAKGKAMLTVGLTGVDGGNAAPYCDFIIKIILIG